MGISKPRVTAFLFLAILDLCLHNYRKVTLIFQSFPIWILHFFEQFNILA